MAMEISRNIRKEVKIGDIAIGGKNPIAVQSMTNTDTRDIAKTLDQISRLTDAGCEIVRVAVPDKTAAYNLGKIKSKINIPLVADIHFDAELALISIAEGVDKLRLNPGNIHDRKKIEKVAIEAKKANVAIRVGSNSGSVDIKKYGHLPIADAMVESVMEHIELLEAEGFFDIVVSLKSSNVWTTLEANRKFLDKRDYPLHIGVTESGPKFSGGLKSAVGLTLLLNEGIGDTMRVSLTADPADEVYAGFKILRELGISERGVEIISCPLCGRAEVNLIPIVQRFEEYTKNIKKSAKVAIMGCIVNGPGEARDADFGFAFGKGGAAFFKKGEVIGRIKTEVAWNVLVDELDKL